MLNLLFYLGFATLIAHELDAMTHAEWRLLWLLRDLPEPAATTAFVVGHIPLVAGLLWLTHSDTLALRRWSRIGIAAFLAVHAALHRRLDHLPAYEFDTALSLGLIYGAGGLGLLYLGAAGLAERQTPGADP
jgi:hypothetical protein